MMNPVRVPDRALGPDRPLGPSTPAGAAEPQHDADAVERLPRLTGVAELFHQLNNQLGIILANAELLEQKARDDTSRARAAQVVTSVLEALGTARSLRKSIER